LCTLVYDDGILTLIKQVEFARETQVINLSNYILFSWCFWQFLSLPLSKHLKTISQLQFILHIIIAFLDQKQGNTKVDVIVLDIGLSMQARSWTGWIESLQTRKYVFNHKLLMRNIAIPNKLFISFRLPALPDLPEEWLLLYSLMASGA
jgi:hypothetical protein